MKIRKFFKNFACGAAIGIAVIIPGVSGGTIAVITNVYDKIIGAISNIFKDFKNSVLFLLPILAGAIAAFAAMYFPLQFALEHAPLPTVLLFSGLMAGTLPKLVKDGAKHGFRPATDIAASLLPMAVIIGICFIPELGNVNLGNDMPVWGYFALIGVGVLGACALVVPGISGSMLLLILGYYEPVLATFKLLFSDFGHSLLVLALFAVGVIAGFFTIAKLMKFLLEKFPRTTYWAIIGFVIGSIPAIFIAFPANFPEASYDTVQIVVGALLCAAGLIGSYAFTAFAESRMKADGTDPTAATYDSAASGNAKSDESKN